MDMSETCNSNNLWIAFQKVRSENKDATANIMWFSRKRDEALTPENYLYFNQQVCKFIKEQSNLQIQETSLFLELQNCFPEYK